jgi:hypothetical protein
MSRPRIDEVLVLLRVPDESRERGLEQLAEDLTAIAWELEDASYNAGGSERAVRLDAVQGLVDEAARILREMLEARHLGELAALETLCAHCGHDRGDHLVEAPHACEAEASERLDELLGLEPDEAGCGCPGFVPPGTYRDTMRTLHDAETIPPPAPAEEHGAAL